MRPMRPSHHADESILRMHVRQVRELDLCTVEATATCTVKTPWNTHPTAVSPLKPSHSPLSIWVCFPRLHSSFSRLSPLLEQRQGSKDHRLATSQEHHSGPPPKSRVPWPWNITEVADLVCSGRQGTYDSTASYRQCILQKRNRKVRHLAIESLTKVVSSDSPRKAPLIRQERLPGLYRHSTNCA